MQKKIIIAITIAASLVGCGAPTSNSSGTDQATGGGISSAIQWTKKMVRGWTVKASVQQPAATLIADALLDQDFLGKPINGSAMRTLASLLGDSEKALTTILSPSGAETGVGYVLPLAAVNSAYRGWQVQLIDMSVFGEPKTPDNQIRTYLAYQEAAVEYSNNLVTEIATRLTDEIGVAEDPDAARREVQKIFLSIPNERLNKIWDDAAAHALAHHRTLDMSGSGGVDWTTNDGSSFSGKSDGLTWEKRGVVWFGKGKLSGKDWTIGLENSISKSTDKSTSGSLSIDSKTSTKTTGSANVK